MKTAAVIQARISSTRLRAKALIPLSGKPMIVHVIERAKAIMGVDRVILATGSGDADLPLVKIAAETGIDSFRGSEDNVLERFYMAVENFGCDYIMRITGDNPLTDHISAGKALDYAYGSLPDHCSITGIPLGTGVEIISRYALEKAFRESTEPYHFEHVTPYIKEHPELFSIEKYHAAIDNPFQELRLTVDTAEDLELMKTIYDRLYAGRPILLGEVISLIKDNPDMARINSHVEQRPMTHSSHE